VSADLGTYAASGPLSFHLVPAGKASATGAGRAAVSWVVAVRAKRMAILKRMVISGSMRMKVEIKTWMLGKRVIEATEVVDDVDADADGAVVDLDRQLLIYC
jgi:hypothetical protein